jgi:hypothetical protein
VVAADRADLWAVLTDPDMLASLTPLLERIDADGDLWRWDMAGLSVLGVGVAPSFTERMRFEEARLIEYTHEPPAGVVERAGATGWYRLSDVHGGVELAIRLRLSLELPLSRVVAPAVTRAMAATMQAIGNRFSRNLLRHLGVEPPVPLSESTVRWATSSS